MNTCELAHFAMLTADVYTLTAYDERRALLRAQRAEVVGMLRRALA
jgi:hypothetical protein